jgi:hypothetical protein
MSQPNPDLAGPGIMLLSAALFGYFGFATTWLTMGNNGQFLLFVAILEWTLKISAVGFLIAAIITGIRPVAGNVLYAVISLLGAVAFLVVLVMDVMDKQHMVLHPVLLAIFAGWNGYGALTSLKQLLTARPTPVQA